MAGHMASLGDRRNAYKVLVEKLEGKSPLEQHRHRWEDHITMDLKSDGVTGYGT
jgi:hypothetical protein